MATAASETKALEANCISHGLIRPVRHPEFDVEVNGQSVVRYLRFGQSVAVDRLELKPACSPRFVPTVTTHPAHVTVSVPDLASGAWRVIKDVQLPPVPVIAGEGLRQDMAIEEMERLLAAGRDVTHQIDLGGLQTSVLRVECDREHPVWPNHGEMNGVPFSVPFATLDSLVAMGTPPAARSPLPAYVPPLQKGVIRPEAPVGMTVENLPWMVVFRGPRLSVGFSLRRPQLMHLGWDGTASGQSNDNRISTGRTVSGLYTGPNGPVLRTFGGDFGANVWPGKVEVDGNRVTYSALDCWQGVQLDASFTVSADAIEVEFTQRAPHPVPAIELEAWRMNFNCAHAMTAAAGVPTLHPGRNGEVELPMFWAGDGNGCLRCEKLDGDAYLQVESYRRYNQVVGGIVLADRPGLDGLLLVPAGTRTSRWRWSVTAFEPEAAPGAKLSGAMRKHWGSIYSCFRPEYGGFSNNAVSVNCHVTQCAQTEIVAMTRRPERGPDPLTMHRFTIERALLGGGGYGFWRNLFQDSDPCLVSGAGGVYSARPDKQWLEKIKPGLSAAAKRMLGTIGDEGLAINRDLSGNSGSFRWSSNAMDVVGFGHMDAYVNAWTYRGLRNAAAMFRVLKDGSLADRCTEAAERLRQAYAPQLLNPETGFVAGWRSRDGQLHDSAFVWVNGLACAFGLLDAKDATEALRRLEALREEVGASDAQFGLPFNLRPIPTDDHMLPKMWGRFTPTFENYTDGSMTPTSAPYYLRALDIYGLHDRAESIANDLEVGYDRGHFNGGVGSGVEYFRWEGTPCGYEGTFIFSWVPLYAIAVHRGLLKPSKPEWWPE